MKMDDVKEFVEKKLADAKKCSSADMVMNCRAQAFGVIMFAQKFLPYDELQKYWEGEDGIWQKFNDMAREKNR
jgi:hypothetical protein